MPTTINVIDRVTPQLRRLHDRVSNPTPGLLIAGRTLSNLLRRFYTDKNTREPNKLGGDRTNFWLGIKRAVNNPRPTGPAQVTVSISHPAILQKVHGGTITAKRARFLTIPVDPRAHGRYASVLENKFGIKLFAVTKGGRSFLAGRITEGRGSALRVFYILKRSVTQRPDPTALPPARELEETALKAFTDWATPKVMTP